MFASNGADEMSVFHAKPDGNGTKPLRLALSPVLMPMHAEPAGAGFTVMLRSTVTDWAVGLVESVTLIATVDVPSALGAGVPEMAPVELLIDNPLGRPVAL